MHVGLPESAVMSGEFQWRLKGTGKLFTGFLCCVKASHNLDCLDVLYRGVRFDCNVELHSNHV